MTTAEFSTEFDLLYDNANSNAPGINAYEKSVFLTLAQEEIVKETYSGYTQTRIAFEGNERRRRQLSELVRDYKTTTQLSNYVTTGGLGTIQDREQNLITSSQFFGLPSDLLYIVLESVILGGTNSCLNGKKIKVKPITHDEFQVDIDNPFKKPNLRKAWRMDLFKYGASQQAELFAIDTISEYHIRYVKKPKPIVLADFEEDDDTAGMNLTIDGYNTRKDCELNTEIHRDILTRAVDLAVLTARENNMMTRVQVNKKIV